MEGFGLGSIKKWLETRINAGFPKIKSQFVPLSVPPLGLIWAAAGFIDTLLRWKMKLEVKDGYQKEIQQGVQARGCEDGQGARGGADAGCTRP